MDKDRAIITQVSAKIAADLTNKTTDVDARLGEFATLFSSINEIMMDTIYGGTTNSQAVQQNTAVISMLKQELGAEEVQAPAKSFSSSSSSSTATVTVKGTQHGPLPDWLIKACKRDGVTVVYDNRDGLAENPKRPSFRAVDAEKAYWPPRAK
jgi:hypothetical protein